MSDLASVIQDMTGAAKAYLNGLSSEGREQTTLPFDDVERRKWYYTPTPRAGLPLLNMTPRQQQPVLALLSTCPGRGCGTPATTASPFTARPATRTAGAGVSAGTTSACVTR